ncbi:MAG: hypothetical protein AAF468_09310 [Pseudomonadota bacterium]
MRAIASASVLLTALALPQVAFADDSGELATDFCHAVQAAVSCRTTLSMKKSLEEKLSKEAGAPLRGDASPYGKQCNAGYSKFYDAEEKIGKAAACKEVLALYGPEGAKRAGLVSPVTLPASMKVTAEEAEVLAGHLCYAQAAAKHCGSDARISADAETTVSGIAGINMKNGGKFFNSACAGGAFRFGLSKGKNPPECEKALALYGTGGSAFPGLLVGEPTGKSAAESMSESVKTEAKSEAAETTTKAEAKTELPEGALKIVTEFPGLPEGQTIEGMIGGAPGMADEATCQTLEAEVGKASAALKSGNLGERATASIQYAALVMEHQATCPAVDGMKLPISTIAEVNNTGLEACHIAIAGAKAIDDRGKVNRRGKNYRAYLANGKARIWALEAFEPSCSELTKRRMESSIKFAKSSLERNQAYFGCQIWQQYQRDQMKVVRDLSRNKDYVGAITLLDTKLVAAIAGMEKNCEAGATMDNTKKYWLSQRKSVQLRLTR